MSSQVLTRGRGRKRMKAEWGLDAMLTALRTEAGPGTKEGRCLWKLGKARTEIPPWKF